MATDSYSPRVSGFTSHNTRMTFEEWMKRVDNHIGHTLPFMDSNDIPDWRYRDAYDEGMTPKRAAQNAIRQAREF